jgi:signal transduction histidine kinase
VVAVNDALAEKYAKQILAKNKDTGYLQTYRYMRSEAEGVTVCVFINANRELESVQSFILSSLAISALGILMVFALVVLLSETALKPIIESYEKQKRFITDAGHEMKTPLTVIAANAEIIEMENGDSQWISGIKNQVAKLASLTEKLVILSKMEEGVKLEMNEFSLSEALFDTCEQYRSIAMSEGVTFDLAISENVLMIGNEGEIRRVASLLLDNAFRYVNGGGTVSVRAQKLVSGVEIRFTNSTDGVEKGSLDRWFDRFYRTDLSRNSATGGSGIGLSVVKAIVLAHGGSVKASSSDGVNVEFTINI